MAKRKAKKKSEEVSITRSFSYKLGQPNYSSVDFFCSVSDTCHKTDIEKVGKELDEFCRAEVRKSIVEFLASQKAKEKQEIKADKEKVAAKSNKKAKKSEEKEEARESAELEAGDIETPASDSEEYINAN
jgi:hypothetical protein